MKAHENKTGLPLVQLGVTRPEELTALFADLRGRFDDDCACAHDESAWKLFRDRWLGRKSGVLAQITDNWLRPATPELKPAVGASLNELRAHVESQIEARRMAIESGADEAALAKDRVDLSLPGVLHPIGSHHLIRQVFQEIEDIFFSIGFSVVEGPEIETPYYNFEALNIPEHHPARDTMDTFYVETPAGAPPLLLRTHTSPLQIRTMEKQPPPVRIIVPGKVYRRDNPDATHSPTFQQIEGLYVDRNVTVGDLKGTVEFVFKELMGSETRIRFRPHYFSYTEPSFELDFSSPLTRKMGKEWLEIAGCGMVHPQVFENVGYDPETWTGWAFGFGIERIAMIRYGINDIRF